MYKIEFSREELQTISAGLGKLPAEAVIPLLTKISKEVTAQDKIAEAAADVAKPKKGK